MVAEVAVNHQLHMKAAGRLMRRPSESNELWHEIGLGPMTTTTLGGNVNVTFFLFSLGILFCCAALLDNLVSLTVNQMVVPSRDFIPISILILQFCLSSRILLYLPLACCANCVSCYLVRVKFSVYGFVLAFSSIHRIFRSYRYSNLACSLSIYYVLPSSII